MVDSLRKRVNVAAVVLKCLAMAAIVQPVLSRHVSKTVTVFAQALPGAAGSPNHGRSYTYFSGFHVLSFNDIKWSLTIGLALYLAAVALQIVAGGRLLGQSAAPERLSS
jgi:hypothetical protein